MPLQEKFKEILASKTFEKLDPYTRPESWHALSYDERELLGILFIKHAEHCLKDGTNGAGEILERALKVAPDSTLVCFNQAMTYASQGQNALCLSRAAHALNKAIDLNPTFTGAWHASGNISFRLGKLHDEPKHFHEADKKFKQASQLSDNHHYDKKADLFWHWGLNFYSIGEHSGEAVDFSQAIEKLRKSAELGIEAPAFHNDFGNALFDMGMLLGRPDLFIEASELYRKYTESQPELDEGWINLASTYQRLYDHNGSLDHFQEADLCFEQAIQINPHNTLAWLKWAELYSCRGKWKQDAEFLKASLGKFEKANELDPENAQVLLRWGEAQVVAAGLTENLHLLREGEKKIAIALKDLREEAEAWYVSGVCQVELGRYFSDERYYNAALERFTEGLRLNPSHILLKHSMALTHLTLGEMEEDISKIELGIGFFNRLTENEQVSFPQLYNDWGVALMKLGELTGEKIYIEEAAEKFEKAINMRIDTARCDDVELEWFYNYGCAMDFLGDFHEDPTYYEKSILVLSHVLKQDAKHVYARYHLALALFHLGELNEDVESLDRAIDIFHDLIAEDPEDEITWNDYGMALLNLAILSRDAALPEKGLKLFEQAESKFLQTVALGNVYGYYNLACLHALLENVPVAMHYMERAAQTDSLPLLGDVMHDEWLDNLHDLPIFKQFVAKIIEKQNNNLTEDSD